MHGDLLDVRLYADEIATQFGLGALRQPPAVAARGELGVVWRVDSEQGGFALKQHLQRVDPESVQATVAFQERFARSPGREYAVPVPIRTVEGGLLAEVGGMQLSVQSWVDLADADPDLDPVLFARVLADLHRVAEPCEGTVDPWYTAPVGRERWAAHVAALRAQGRPGSEQLAAAVPDLLRLEQLLASPRALRTCHRDLWADNVRATPSGRLCVIDWDNAGPADPGHELAAAVFEYGYPDDERCRALIEAYRAAGGPGRVESAGSFSMLIAQFGHFYELAVARWLDPQATPDDAARADASLDELSSKPLTPAAVEHLLGLVGE